MNLMKYTLAIALFFSLAVLGVQALEVPGDSNGDKIVSAEELAAAEKLAQEGKLSEDQLQEIKHIHERYPIHITDSANRTVTIYRPVKTIVPMSWSNYEPIFVLGGFDKVVGVRTDLRDAYSWIPGMSKKTTIGGSQELDYEKVIELKPDLVISAASKVDNLASKLDPAGIPYIIIFRTLNQDTYDNDLRIVAKILEKEEQANEFLTWKQSCLDQLQERTHGIKLSDRIRVYSESADLPFYAAANTSGINDIISKAGGINIASGLTGKPCLAEVEPEWVLKENPDAIVITAALTGAPVEAYLGYSAANNASKNLDDFILTTRNRTGLKDTNAAKEGKIYVLEGTYAGFGRGFIGAYYMAKWFYPEVFKDLDPEAIDKEYFEKWLGVPYKGIWAYP